MTNIEVNVKWAEEILKKLDPKHLSTVKRKFFNAALIITGNILTMEETPIWANWLLRKATWYVQEITEDYGKIVAKPVYALYVHEWTKPHMPPVWDASDKFSLAHRAQLKGLNPWAVAMWIKKHGTKANQFMERTAKKVEPKLLWLLKKYADEFISS